MGKAFAACSCDLIEPAFCNYNAIEGPFMQVHWFQSSTTCQWTVVKRDHAEQISVRFSVKIVLWLENSLGAIW